MKRYELGGHEEEWYCYLSHEREALLLRANGLLAHTLSGVQPGEPREALEHVASEDQRVAREGLVKLLSEDGEVSYKHIDDLTPYDVAARRRAEVALLGFLRERVGWRLERSGRWLPRPPYNRGGRLLSRVAALSTSMPILTTP